MTFADQYRLERAGHAIDMATLADFNADPAAVKAAVDRFWAADAAMPGGAYPLGNTTTVREQRIELALRAAEREAA